jgi:hypothetical protein
LINKVCPDFPADVPLQKTTAMEQIFFQLAGIIEAGLVLMMLFIGYKIIQTLEVGPSKKRNVS